MDYTVKSTSGDTLQIEIVAVKNSVASIASNLGVSTSEATTLDNAVTAAAGDATVSAAFSSALNAGGGAEAMRKPPSTGWYSVG